MNLEKNMEISGIGDRIKIQGQSVEVRGGGGCLLIVGLPVPLRSLRSLRGTGTPCRPRKESGSKQSWKMC